MARTAVTPICYTGVELVLSKFTKTYENADNLGNFAWMTSSSKLKIGVTHSVKSYYRTPIWSFLSKILTSHNPHLSDKVNLIQQLNDAIIQIT